MGALGSGRPCCDSFGSFRPRWFGRGRILRGFHADFRPRFRLDLASSPGIPIETLPLRMLFGQVGGDAARLLPCVGKVFSFRMISDTRIECRDAKSSIASCASGKKSTTPSALIKLWAISLPSSSCARSHPNERNEKCHPSTGRVHKVALVSTSGVNSNNRFLGSLSCVRFRGG